MRQRRLLITLLATFTLLVTVMVPANADEREKPDWMTSDEPVFVLTLDPENGLSIFWNIKADRFCDWQASGFDGPPPVEKLITISEAESEAGALMGSFRGSSNIEVWTLDDDVPPYVGPCEDIENQDEPWATGVADMSGYDDDFNGDTLPINTFGEEGRAMLHDTDGARWTYDWFFEVQASAGGEVRVDESYVLEQQ